MLAKLLPSLLLHPLRPPNQLNLQGLTTEAFIDSVKLLLQVLIRVFFLLLFG